MECPALALCMSPPQSMYCEGEYTALHMLEWTESLPHMKVNMTPEAAEEVAARQLEVEEVEARSREELVQRQARAEDHPLLLEDCD